MAYGADGVQIHTFSTSALHMSSHLYIPAALSRGKRPQVITVRSGTGLDAVVQKNLSPLGNEPGFALIGAVEYSLHSLIYTYYKLLLDKET
jgi:hypothetical protein